MRSLTLLVVRASRLCVVWLSITVGAVPLASSAWAEALILSTDEQMPDDGAEAAIDNGGRPNLDAPSSVRTPSSTQIPNRAGAQSDLQLPPLDYDFPDRATPPPRFSLRRVDGGLLRLDSRSGKIAFCRPNKGDWACEAVPEHRAFLEQENARLREEVARLKAQLDTAREALSATKRQNGNPSKLDDNFTQIRMTIENAWLRMVETIAKIQKDVVKKIQLHASL